MSALLNPPLSLCLSISLVRYHTLTVVILASGRCQLRSNFLNTHSALCLFIWLSFLFFLLFPYPSFFITLSLSYTHTHTRTHHTPNTTHHTDTHHSCCVRQPALPWLIKHIL